MARIFTKTFLLVMLLLPFPALAQPPVIAINEFMAINQGSVMDSSGNFADWIELYNNSGHFIDLSEYYLTDNYLNPTKWMFPVGTGIDSGGYVIIWCDNDTFQPGIHAYFKLGGSGEQIMLSDPSGNVVDSISFGQQIADTSTGRYPNASGPFLFMVPTPLATNSPGFVAVQEPVIPFASAYPNPSSTYVNITWNKPWEGTLYLYDGAGRLTREYGVNHTGNMTLDVILLPIGIYYLSGEGIIGTTICVNR